MDNTAQCICPTCPNILKPVCASDGVEDLSECHLERQACQGNVNVSVAKRTSCGALIVHFSILYVDNSSPSPDFFKVSWSCNHKIKRV